MLLIQSVSNYKHCFFNQISETASLYQICVRRDLVLNFLMSILVLFYYMYRLEVFLTKNEYRSTNVWRQSIVKKHHYRTLRY